MSQSTDGHRNRECIRLVFLCKLRTERILLVGPLAHLQRLAARLRLAPGLRRALGLRLAP
jgi:hypothetical protein